MSIVLEISNLFTKMFCTNEYDDGVVYLLRQLSCLLLTKENENHVIIDVDENYEALIWILCKSVIKYVDLIPKKSFFWVFKCIVSLILYFFGQNREKLGYFIKDYPKVFAKSYLVSVISVFFQGDDCTNQVSTLSLLVFLHFPSNYHENPFFISINELADPFFPGLFECFQKTIQKCINNTFFLTLLMENSLFMSFCLSSVSISWIKELTSDLFSDRDVYHEELMLRLFYHFSKDSSYFTSVSKEIDLSVLITSVITNIRKRIKDNYSRSVVDISFLVLETIGHCINSMSIQSSENLFSLLRYIDNIEHPQKFHYIEAMLLFINTVFSQRLRLNVSLLYTSMRSIDLLLKIGSHDGSIRFSDILHEIQGISCFYIQKLSTQMSDDFDDMIKTLKHCVDTSIYPINSLHLQNNQKIESSQSLKFFKFVILMESKNILKE